MSRDKPTVYLETTIISYLAAWPSRDLVTAAHQQITHEWWNTRRNGYSLNVSEFVVGEAAGGDPDAASRRLVLVQAIPLLDVNEAVRNLARGLTRSGSIPDRYATDAFHIAVAAVHRVDYLLSWNCRHIANAGLWNAIAQVCGQHGCRMPNICTPYELLGD